MVILRSHVVWARHNTTCCDLFRRLTFSCRRSDRSGAPWAAPRAVVVEALRAATAAARQSLQSEQAPSLDADALREMILADAQRRVHAALGPHYRKAINATGIILHTGLGRAVLPARALRQISEELAGYSVLQIDAASGAALATRRADRRTPPPVDRRRGGHGGEQQRRRHRHRAQYRGRRQGGDRLPRATGRDRRFLPAPRRDGRRRARLVEVGTTNKTHLRDYQQAITADTAAILRVHPSNYKIVGFTAEVPLEELVGLGRARGLTVDRRRGRRRAGRLFPVRLREGADAARVGGRRRRPGHLERRQDDRRPAGRDHSRQGGLDQAVRKNPLARIVRVDKLPLAALEATLTLFLDEAWALAEVPTLRMLLPRIGRDRGPGRADRRGNRRRGARREARGRSTACRRWEAVRCPARTCRRGWCAVARRGIARRLRHRTPSIGRPRPRAADRTARASLRPRVHTGTRCSAAIPARCWTATQEILLNAVAVAFRQQWDNHAVRQRPGQTLRSILTSAC